MYIFFTIPIWVILAVAFFVIGFAGAGAAWLAEHILLISALLWALVILGALCMGTGIAGRLRALSFLLPFLPSYALLVASLIDLGRAFKDGKVLEMVLYIPGWLMLACIVGFVSFCIAMLAEAMKTIPRTICTNIVCASIYGGLLYFKFLLPFSQGACRFFA